MFTSLINNPILDFVLTGCLIIFVISYAYSQWKSGSTKANLETVTAFRSEIEAMKLTMTRLNEQIAMLQSENAKVNAELNQMRGKNTVLEQVLSLRDPQFEKSFLTLTQSIKDMRDDLRKHYDEDKINFAEMSKLIKSNGSKETK